MFTKEPRRGVIIVSGILFWYPLAGVTFQFLHYLLGLRRLGYDVYYIEDCGHWVYDPRSNDLTPDVTGNLDTVVPILEAHGLAGKWGFRGRYEGGSCYGMTYERMRELYSTADAFLNVTGAQDMGEDQLRCARRIYVESDPFPLQVGLATGSTKALEVFRTHDTFFTFGENLGNPDCTVPTGTVRWLPTRQPVVCDLWVGAQVGGRSYNTITTWRNEGKDVEYQGDTYYWTKDREFEKFLDLPLRRDVPFELAAKVEPDILRRLTANRWSVVDSTHVSRDIETYRSYIQSSRGEFTVARDQYVRPRTGWFSDRSACYLAAGRPVITQETGFSKFVPSGKGLFGFETIEDVLAAVDAIESDYEGHCAAALEVGAEYFGAETVLVSLMQRAGLY